MAHPATDYQYYTWDDYRSWPDDERWELIDGHPYAMSPSPGVRHQRIVTAITVELHAFLQGGPCDVFVAPLDVKLSEADIVQPDVLVVCDPRKIKDTHIEGAPDVVVEIASPSSVCHDRTRKLSLYAKSGIREYWLVTPYPHLVEVLTLDGDGYRLHRTYLHTDVLTSPALPGFELNLVSIFDFPIPDDERIDEVRESPPPYGRQAP